MSKERGFTLVELLVAVVILGAITGALTTGLIVSFRTTDEATDRLSRAQGVQLASSAFASDVQSADDVLAGDAAPACGPSGAALSLVWMDGSVRNVAAYSVQGDELVRHHCVGATIEERTLSSFVAVAAAPVCSTAGITAACTVSAQAPREVAWQLTDTGGDALVLRGTRRVT